MAKGAKEIHLGIHSIDMNNLNLDNLPKTPGKGKKCSPNDGLLIVGKQKSRKKQIKVNTIAMKSAANCAMFFCSEDVIT